MESSVTRENCETFSLLGIKKSFDAIFIGNATGDNFLALKHCVSVSQQLSRVPSPTSLARYTVPVVARGQSL